MVTHNLPEQPYKKFFGRKDSIEKIKEILLEGATFIASIDGVGGIGKTALAYYFCKDVVFLEGVFKNIIWITAKETVFDPFSIESMIKKIGNKFKGINTLIDVTLATIGFEEYLDEDFKIKKELFEEFIKSDSVLMVLDNLESVDDEEFFKYIKNDFNKFASSHNNGYAVCFHSLKCSPYAPKTSHTRNTSDRVKSQKTHLKTEKWSKYWRKVGR